MSYLAYLTSFFAVGPVWRERKKELELELELKCISVLTTDRP